ncbi:MAG: M48 family metallopeptidase [Syntrophobacteraceae bacterium]
MRGEKTDFDFQIRQSARRKTVSITVYPDNRVIVSVPKNFSQKKVYQIIEEKSDWVRKKIQANCLKAQIIPKRQFRSGEKLMFLGGEYTLRLECGGPELVAIKDENICVHLRSAPDSTEPSTVRRHLIKWYVSRALEKIEQRVAHYRSLVGAGPRTVTIKAMKSRWGSCSTRGSISLAWNIIMAPEPVLDYLIVHELCHLVHHNHSADYWNLVASVLPDHCDRRKWLRQNGDLLRF